MGEPVQGNTCCDLGRLMGSRFKGIRAAIRGD